MMEGPVDLQGWYSTKVTKLKLEPYELAEQIRLTTEHILFSAAIDELQVETESIEDEVVPTARVLKVVNETSPCYFLTVTGFMVHVAYGVKWCGHLQAGRHNLVAMLGDWRFVGHSIKGPMMMQLPGTYQEQQELLGGYTYATTGELPAIIEGLSDPNHQGNFVVPEDNGWADLDPTLAWRVLPVHPKIALLFLRGMTVLAAAKLVQEMFEQVPEEAEEKMMALVNFLRVACTTTDADGSAVGVEWALVNQDQSDKVFEWCRGLQNQYYRPVQGAVAQVPRGREVAAVTASPPAGVNRLLPMA